MICYRTAKIRKIVQIFCRVEDFFNDLMMNRCYSIFSQIVILLEPEKPIFFKHSSIFFKLTLYLLE